MTMLPNSSGVVRRPRERRGGWDDWFPCSPKAPGRGLDVLLGQGGRHVGRHQVVLRHHLGLEPYAHRVVGAEVHHVADARYTLQYGHDVDFHVVVEEFLGVRVGRVDQGHADEHRCLALLGLHAHLVYLGGEEVGGLGHTVLHVHGGHVGVKSLLECHRDGGRAGVGGRRGDILHTLGAVDRLLQRCDHRVEHGLRVGAVVGGRYLDGRGGYIRILRDRHRYQADKTQQDDEDRYHRRQHRAVDESVKFHCR